jgi:hypothetical protein
MIHLADVGQIGICHAEAMKERLALPTATFLGLATLGLWLYLLLFQAVGVEVANQTGAVTGGLTVCGQEGTCLHRTHLWPRQTWRVPLPPEENGRVKLMLRDAGATRLAVTRPSEDGEVHFVLGAGGHIGVQQ